MPRDMTLNMTLNMTLKTPEHLRANDDPKCPVCSNDDPKLIEFFSVAGVIVARFCLVCSKEWAGVPFARNSKRATDL